MISGNISLLLNKEFDARNNSSELSFDKPDPLLIASKFTNEYAILLCALFAYGNAKQIVKFIDSLPFYIFDENKNYNLDSLLDNKYYRFQNNNDVIEIFKTFLNFKKHNISLLSLFLNGYKKNNNVIEGIDNIINEIYKINSYSSQGYSFLIGKPSNGKTKGVSAFKRWNMFLRWMVRDDELDLGLWSKDINTSDLIMPLDTHTFNLGKSLGLIKRKTYDLESAIELTNSLKNLDYTDPVKYDFALYRLGQEKIIK